MVSGSAFKLGYFLRAVRPDDLLRIKLQARQQYMQDLIDDDYRERVLQSPVSFTLEKDGLILGMGGIIQYWPTTGEAWTLLSEHAASHMLTVTRAVRQVLDGAPFTRIQMTTDEGFTEAERWARMLGFKREGFMEKYHADDRGVYLWARVR